MLYREMKKAGDELSILGFGCMRLPQKKGSPGSGKIDEARATRQILHAIEQGVNYFDTAMPYHMGGSEPFLGRALAGGYRDKIKLATKLPPWSVKVRSDMDQLLKVQLANLRTEWIDYYLVHALAKSSWDKMKSLGVLEFLDAAKADGRIINAGFSFHGDKDTFKEIVDAYDWEFCQIQFNFLDRQNQAGSEGLAYAAAKDLGVIIMEPLRGGKLGGKIPPAVQAVWDEADTRRSAAEWSLRWIWHHPEVTVVLSGMNEEAHIDENIRIASEARPESLTDKELAMVERVEAAYRSLMKAGCTSCRYCMPCPAGVDIPACFEVYNDLHMFGDSKAARLNYFTRVAGGMGGEPACASLCENCGQCEDACPQDLPVQELLKEVAQTFEKWWLRPAVWLIQRAFAAHRWVTLRRARRNVGRG
jgi:uncharacterized protein